MGDTSGYRIDYTNGRDSGSRNINDGLRDEYVLFGLENGTTYNISILGTSNHFFSETITITVELIEEGDLIIIKIIMNCILLMGIHYI